MPAQDDPPRPDSATWRNGFALIACGFAVLALLSPLSPAAGTGRVGLLLILTAFVEFAHSFRRASGAGQRSAWVGGLITATMGFLLLHSPNLAATAIVMFLAGLFALDSLRAFGSALFHQDQRKAARYWLLAGVGNLIASAGLLAALTWDSILWTAAVAGAVRIFGTAWTIAYSPVFTLGESGKNVVESLGLSDSTEVRELADRLTAEEVARADVDRGWIFGYIAVLFAIHLGRMGFDHETYLGIVSPGVAVLGDLAGALILAFGVVIPCSVMWRRLTRPLERFCWGWCLAVPEGQRGWGRRVMRAAMARRMRLSIRLVKARYSIRMALSRGLQIGLPLVAVVAATVPVWGMSWYFDTENWAAGAWNNWAEARTDTWREAMTATPFVENEAARGGDKAFAVSPPGVSGDFSFLVIGDTGEGDASQHSLRASWLDVVRRPEVKFAVISSDVIYPTGAMRDYEANFWLPFMGTTKPIYAIPGNHDWYDALEGFNATFLEPQAARAAMRARIEIDRRVTSTNERRIDQLIAQAKRLGQEYGVPTQFQKAPFFQVQTDRLALIAVDTGISRRVDPTQEKWLRAALASAAGKLKMVILGHPLYAGGAYTTTPDQDFGKLHALLKEYDVHVVMAGDTHDLEYYAEQEEGSSETVHHFVNGGGGAYLSLGTALAWPIKPATSRWVHYPTKEQVVTKVDDTIHAWKTPAWWWTKKFGAWPFSAEWLSAAFDSNVAPFHQSFMEIRCEPSKGRIRLLPYGVHRQLRWGDVQASPEAIPAGATAETPIEWVVTMPPKGK